MCSRRCTNPNGQELHGRINSAPKKTEEKKRQHKPTYVNKNPTVTITHKYYHNHSATTPPHTLKQIKAQLSASWNYDISERSKAPLVAVALFILKPQVHGQCVRRVPNLREEGVQGTEVHVLASRRTHRARAKKTRLPKIAGPLVRQEEDTATLRLERGNETIHQITKMKAPSYILRHWQEAQREPRSWWPNEVSAHASDIPAHSKNVNVSCKQLRKSGLNFKLPMKRSLHHVGHHCPHRILRVQNRLDILEEHKAPEFVMVYFGLGHEI